MAVHIDIEDKEDFVYSNTLDTKKNVLQMIVLF